MRTAIALLLSLMTSATLQASPATQPAVEFTSHRGESADAPENTLAAFKLGWERNVDAVELDVHLSKDGKLVIIHDADTQRTAGQKLIVKDHTAAELAKLDVGSWKNPQYAAERIATLDQAIALVPPGKKRLFIEVKVGPESVPELVRVIKASNKPAEQLVVISFKIETCIAAKKALPNHKVYWIVSPKQNKDTKAWNPTHDELIAKAKAAGLDGLDLSYKFPIDAGFVQRVREAGLELYCWTCDDPAAARELIAAGVNGITSNKAAWLSGELKKN
jgi:glycerophosphoryl diester phosphodiesterase